MGKASRSFDLIADVDEMHGNAEIPRAPRERENVTKTDNGDALYLRHLGCPTHDIRVSCSVRHTGTRTGLFHGNAKAAPLHQY